MLTKPCNEMLTGTDLSTECGGDCSFPIKLAFFHGDELVILCMAAQ